MSDQTALLDMPAIEGLSGAQIAAHEAARSFALAGNATFTVVSRASRDRLTFKIQTPKGEEAPHFVKVLSGPSNEADYRFLGTIFADGTLRIGSRKRPVDPSSKSAKTFAWLWKALQTGRGFDLVEFWHEGRCGSCGRKLTVPESIATGLGPVCAEKGGF